jgi:LPS O-antigen subunit length determinant protein (WzzB/FepE family)
MTDLAFFLGGCVVGVAVIETRNMLRRPKPRRRK